MKGVPSCAALVVILIAGQARGGPSTYSHRSGGAKAFYLLLKDLGYRTGRIDAPRRLADEKARALVVLGEIPQRREERVLEWVREGNLLVTALPLIEETGLCMDTRFGELALKRKYQLVKSKPRHQELSIRPSACLMKVPAGGELLAGTEEQAVAVDLVLGKGRILLLAHEDLVVNANLNNDDTVVLVRRWLFNHVPARGRIVFLEQRLPVSKSIWSSLRQAGLSPFLLHGLIWLLLLYWSRIQRFGDPTPVFVETRREFAQHARALGHLYLRRRASATMLRRQYERFIERVLGRTDTAVVGVRAVSRHHSELRQNRSALAALIATRTGRDAESVESLLAQVEYTIGSPEIADPKQVQRHFRLSQALAALQHTSAAQSASGDRRGRTKIR